MLHDVAYLLYKLGVNLVEIGGCGLACEIGGGGYDGAFEALDELLAEWVAGEADGDAAVGGDEVGG